MSSLLVQSIVAFVGAFSAFCLVIVTDRRRLHRKKEILKRVISDNGEHTLHKISAVERSFDKFEAGIVTPAPYMPYQKELITQLHAEVIDLLDANYNQSVSALIYWMTSIDGLLEEASNKAEKIVSFESRSEDQAEKEQLFEEYGQLLSEAIVNMRSLNKMIEYYVAGSPTKIIEYTH